MVDIATASQRREIPDWYHLKENLLPLSPMKKKLFNLKFDSNYILDDYIIFAQI